MSASDPATTWPKIASACWSEVTRVTFANTSNLPITPACRTGCRQGSATSFSVNSAVPSGRGRLAVRVEEYRSNSKSSPAPWYLRPGCSNSALRRVAVSATVANVRVTNRECRCGMTGPGSSSR
ncbi:MAG TPA: hypothetical protein VNV62_16005 [Trebonia sp.]|nr:hypothetical protein [Trebonia sp.]